ncbi:MAG TPA: flagellar hook-associated protein FlgK [Deltaproteobacteria bacterium]|jgi:flagellar hook-associated protein 1 FlgK|nr:flagellar hook-associated protein FlgK [Deltaproteobacteria bacterium]HOI08580.1 flagellar hook-associated protein FlgK [Deltaproteobacteria bacterium]
MPGINGALSIASWTLYNSQLALEITSHNVANANTEGYSRQSLKIDPNIPINMGPGEIGTGARAVEVIRAHDEFINSQVNAKRSQYYYWKTQSDAMDEVETIFNETGDTGLNEMMSQFWSAWGDLSNNPDGTPEREALIAKSNNLIQTISNIDFDLRENQRNLDNNIRGSVGQVNAIIEQIADLNNQISSVEIKGSVNANDLRDRRDLLLEKLSEYMDISYYEEENSGQVMVYILGGTPLVLGTETYAIDDVYNTATGLTDLVWQDESGRTVNITNRLAGGKIAGWVNVRDNKIGSYLDSLNTLTDELVWQVNSLHADGTGLESVSSMTGSVVIAAATDDLAADFYFSDRYNAGGQFDIVVYDSAGNVANTYAINPAGSTVQDLITAINAAPELTASITAAGYFNIQADPGYTFAVKPHAGGETSHSLAIMGVNTFFSWAENTVQPMLDITQTIGISDALEANSGLVAAGTIDENNRVAPGNNTVALSVSALRDRVIPNLGGTGVSTTLDSYYSSFIARVGVDVENAVMNETFNDTLLSQYLQKQEGVMGVNLDEEMANILKLQHLYQAAAKIISVCDEMMQSLLSTK